MADYPRNIRLDTDTKARLISYLNEEIQTHRAERGQWVADLTNWQIDYWAEPVEKVKTFPFNGACNIVIPLTAIAVEAVHAREMTTLFALDQFVNVNLPDSYSDLSNTTEEILDKILLKDADMFKFLDNALLENKKFGTAVGKVGYDRVVKKAIKEIDGKEVSFDVVTKQGPVLDRVSLPQFLMPFTCNDPQMAPWCGEEHIKSPYELKLLSQSGFFYPEVYDEWIRYVSQGISNNISSASYVQEVRQLQDQVPIQWPREVSWFEIWLAFDVDGDGREEEIVVHYHLPSQTFFSVRYNYTADLRRPYRITNYFTMENRWAGIGIGKQNEHFQMEVTTQHRQRIDNATLANMRMYKVKQGIGYGPNEPVFPGKIWMVEEMNDVSEIVMTEVYPSSYNNEQQAAVWSNQRTGVSELTLGMPQQGTPGTATGDLTRVQEANRKFDYSFKHSKRFALDIVSDTILTIGQFGVRDPRIFQNYPNGDAVQQLLYSDPETVRSILLDNLTLVGQNTNKLVERSQWTQLAGMTEQYFTSLMQMAMQTQDQQLLMVLKQKAIQASTHIFRQILESFDVRKIDEIILNPAQLMQQPPQNGLSNSNPLQLGPGSPAP